MVGLIKNFELDCFYCSLNNKPDCPNTITCKERIVWVAMDGDGGWFGFRIKPDRSHVKRTGLDAWVTHETPFPIRVEIDWRATLQRVRQGTVRRPK